MAGSQPDECMQRDALAAARQGNFRGVQGGMVEPVTGVEHWTSKGDVRLFMWEKFVGAPEARRASELIKQKYAAPEWTARV